MHHRRIAAWAVRSTLIAVFFLALAGFANTEPEHTTGRGTWLVWGGNLHNTHEADAESAITPANVGRLQQKWVYEAAGSVSAIPTVSDGVVYVPDWGVPLFGGGKLHAIDTRTGRAIWSKPMLEYTKNLLNTVSRTSPAIAGDVIVFGDIVAAPASGLDLTLGHGATLYAARRATGDLVWSTQLDPHPLSVITQSPVVYNGVVYVGVSSLEEPAARLGNTCCTFRGSMVAVELATGKILWQTYMLPDNQGKQGGYAGAAVWGSSPSIDAKRGVVYIATGNDYTFPKPLKDCLAQHRGDAAAQQSQCYATLDASDDYADSVLALDLKTGAVRWAQRLHNYGAWTYACDPRVLPFIPNNPAKCDDLDALDFDFGQAPMIITVRVGGVERDRLAIGQKSGVVWSLDPDASGAVVWGTKAGTGAPLGGMEFGAATDGERIYVQNTNFDHVPFTLTAGPHAGETVNGGTWSALDAATGALLWQTPDPSSSRPLCGVYVSPGYGAFKGPGFFGTAMGPITVANGVMYAGSMDPEGHMYALNAKTGEIVWSFASGGSVMSAPSIVDGVLYWGTGYYQAFNANRLYAFALPGGR
jgi:polyvinyl alcohol dehydrogenase (cytochrome)